MSTNRVATRKGSHEEGSIPMLLLEGDKLCIDQNGISRTYYEIKRCTPSSSCLCQDQKQLVPSLSLEETYDLNSASKAFHLREKGITSPSRKIFDDSGASTVAGNNGVINIGKRMLPSIQLQEIGGGVSKSAGTGSVTWESSIAMSLFSSTNPCFLRGNILELGSGVGLGGMLLYRLAIGNTGYGTLTLSDGNLEVIEACRENCFRANIPLHVKHLEWTNNFRKQIELYDTILASDCAYKEEHINPLVSTMMSHLKPDGCIHIFGPHNRATLHLLIAKLKDSQNMDVQMNIIEMSRYRLPPQRIKEEQKSNYVSQNVVKFIHAVVSSNQNANYEKSYDSSSMHDID
eukprot:CAMPEP_0178916928 /NCGR_PEP_ID=MMETSP0786-20121207/12942_1 /TAXON_ID=186022 /ORGANISM="Thalassionema frauenfeldii, Strain CCMP 1798" /LENGTH=345 /DNA_ID=CAMNT_0020590379 /DNA_START=151 /DNA_END=1188 /DNA_ORIENTATION=+